MRVFKGKGVYAEATRHRGQAAYRLTRNPRKPEEVVPVDLDPQGVPAADGRENWQRSEALASSINIPGFKYIPVPKAMDGVLVPIDEDGQMSGTTDAIRYCDVKQTSTSENMVISENQMHLAVSRPSAILQIVWPNRALAPTQAFMWNVGKARSSVPRGVKRSRAESSARIYTDPKVKKRRVIKAAFRHHFDKR